MKITIIHGEDTRAARERLTQIISVIKNRGWEVVRIVGDKDGVSEKLTAKNLFANQTLFVCEDVSSLVKRDFIWLKKNTTQDLNLLFWHKGEISKKFISNLPKEVHLEYFPLPKIIFRFLEGLRPGNSRNSLNLLHQLLEKESPEFVFALIAKQFRDLYWVKADAASLLYPSWRKAKLKNQAQNFSDEKIKKIIGVLSAADIESKTGGQEISFWLDLIIMRELE